MTAHFENHPLILRRVVHPQARDNYRVIWNGAEADQSASTGIAVLAIRNVLRQPEPFASPELGIIRKQRRHLEGLEEGVEMPGIGSLSAS
jgi:hypothetical protein